MDNTKGAYENVLIDFAKSYNLGDISNAIEFKKTDVVLKSICLESAMETKNMNRVYLDNCLKRSY